MLHAVLLEDSKIDAQIIAANLEDAGYQVALTRVETKPAFLEALRAESVDIVLSDYKLPGFGGEEALQLALELRPDVPFIFVSGALGEHTAIELLKRGATDYVLKDHIERLAPSVGRALREASEKIERRRAEERLRDRERTLSTLMSNLPGMAFRRRVEPPFQLEFGSDGCRALTGLDAVTLRERTRGWADVVHEDDRERLAGEIARSLADGTQLTSTYRIRTHNGELRWVWERSVAQRDADGAVGTVEGFVTDITQQRAIEEEMRQRVEFEQQLIGIVSHDLRNPLNSITLGAAALLKQEGLNAAGTRQVRRILASAERAARMIRDLLDFTQARLGGGIPVTPKRVALNALVEQVVEEFEHSHPERRVVIVEASAVDGAWDADRVMQALGNLIGNAVAYSPEDTTVTVRARAEGDHALIEVHNVGEPIPEERLPVLFKPLSRGTHRVAAGSRSIGLGLYIVQSIARAHGGDVDARSSREEGTTFRLKLPFDMERTT
jgi:phosphoserine phosphatase RsbU/P